MADRVAGVAPNPMVTDSIAKRIIDRLDVIVGLIDKAAPRETMNNNARVHSEDVIEFRALGLSLLEELYGRNHHHFTTFAQGTTQGNGLSAFTARGIMKAVRAEVEKGWLSNTRGLIAAEVFSDFIDMATHLQESNYQRAATIIAGCALEADLKRLCVKHGLAVASPKGDAKRINALNMELRNANIYDASVERQVGVWGELRNKAAHNDEFNEPPHTVKLMIEGIGFFTLRFAA